MSMPMRRKTVPRAGARLAPLVAAAVGLLLSGCAARRPAAAAPTTAPNEEIRALWVDAFHAGIRTAQEAEELVAAAKRAHLNTLFVQVRRRGDALYTRSFEPPLEDPAFDPGFDALENVVRVAHQHGLEVHAWINAMPVWRDAVPPRDPRHIFNQHGPTRSGEENWLTLAPNGESRFPVGYFLDPGHPAAAAHLVEVYLNLVRNYDVDGIHFDYIRYPETEGRLPRGAAVGYNPTALARFRAATGRHGDPDPGDGPWMEWRREQVTQLVRRIYLEAKAIRPRLKVSAAVIAWGKPPKGERDFLDAAPGQRIFQDWHAWLKEGILDLAVPMNYARENDATVRGWFDGWVRWQKRHRHGRQLAVGIGAYLNPPRATLAQVERARRSEGRHSVDGVSFFSYYSLGTPPAPANADRGAGVAATPSPSQQVAFLAEGLPDSAASGGAVPGGFERPALVPRMDWMERPTSGGVAGIVRAPDGRAWDGGSVRLKREGSWFARSRKVRTDGNGFFGFAQVAPGRYRVWIEHDKQGRAEVRVAVTAGGQARALLELR